MLYELWENQSHLILRLYAIRSWYSEEKDFTYGAEAKVTFCLAIYNLCFERIFVAIYLF